jgi:predicted ATPase
VRRVAPFIKDLTPTPVRANGGGGEPPASGPVRLDWVDELDDVYSVEHLSDGTLRVIAIITMLAQPPAALPRLLVIDEPELGLHPLALSLVCELARSVSSRCQILLATQAPAVLDHVGPEEVLVADREDGATRLRTLDPAGPCQGRAARSTLPGPSVLQAVPRALDERPGPITSGA